MASYADNTGAFPFNRLRVLPYKMYTGATNMALDYALADRMQQNQEAILRFYGWDPYCLSLGYHQHINDVRADKLTEDGYHLVRRPTGGSAIFHSEELTYCLIVPGRSLQKEAIYSRFHALLNKALQQLGYDVELHKSKANENYLNRGADTFACFNRPAFMEIKYRNKKVVGSAQKIMKNALLQHGSILIGGKQNDILKYLNIDAAKLNKYQSKLLKSATHLKAIRNQEITPHQISEALLKEFDKIGNISIYYQDVTRDEIRQSQMMKAYFNICDVYNPVG